MFRLKKHVEELEKRVRQLECPHENLVFDKGGQPISILPMTVTSPRCYCKKCEKVIKRYFNLDEFYKDKLEHYKNKVNELESKLDKNE